MKNNKVNNLVFILTCLFISGSLSAQIGSDHVYSFTELPLSSRISGLGGHALALNDDDNALSLVNPSFNRKENDNMLTMSFIDYFGDITVGNAIYSKSFDKFGDFSLGMQYINYGDFTEADETGERYGDFSASENAMTLGWGRMLTDNFTIGANLKTIVSNFYNNNSWGLATDVAGSYISNDGNFAASVLFKNMGRQIKTYGEDREPIPFEMVVGISKRLKHVPFRYILTYSHLEEFDLTYEDPLDDDNQGSLIESENDDDSENKVEDFADKFMRHITIGGEFVPSKNLAIRIGYNYRRRQELKVNSKLALVGFSGGVEVKISKFRIGYSRSSYHLAGALNQFTLSTNLSDFSSKNHDIM